MNLPIEILIALLVWGTFVGIDLVSLPQMMIARPLVAGAIAGTILGDIPTGLKLGVIFELLQYDILPVGAVRYPEYGPATVAAVATAHASAGVLGLGLGALRRRMTLYELALRVAGRGPCGQVDVREVALVQSEKARNELSCPTGQQE